MPRTLFSLLSMIVLLTGTGAAAEPMPTRAAVVLKWNQLMQRTLPSPGNPLTPRTYALTHIAMFDAVNTLEREFTPYHVRLRHPGGASPVAAAAQAAHDVLVVLNASGMETYDGALAEDLGPSPSGFVRRGAELGAGVAKAILEWRQHDGWIVPPPPPYGEPPVPGRWQPTPPANAPATFVHLHHAVPLATLSATQFLPAPPPSLTSARYASDLTEVQRLGRVDGSDRTEEQTAIAKLWSGVDTTTGFFAVWNNVTADVARAHESSLVEAARLFALVNVSIHDALQTTQASKFVYGVWRPVTAIRAADTDLNPETEPDTAWLPLITTPPYPSYAGNLATIGASAARMLHLATGSDREAVVITWKQRDGLPDVVRRFDSFSQAADEEAMARIYGGVHYRFDQVAGQHVGRSVADFVFSRVMTPRHKDD